MKGTNRYIKYTFIVFNKGKLSMAKPSAGYEKNLTGNRERQGFSSISGSL